MAVLSCDYYSHAKKGMVSFSAIIPVDTPTIENKPDNYPTIYLLHGYSGNRHDWLLRTRIEEWAAKYGCAVIMPDGGNRFYLDNEETEELSGVFIGEELVDITRHMFPLSHKREDTTIAGLSMGGFGALRNGLKYKDTFGSIAALSSALITDEISVMEQGERNAVASYGYYRYTFGDLKKLPGSDKDPKHLAKVQKQSGVLCPRIFLACGTEDFLYPQNCDYHHYLKCIGYDHEWWVKTGTHDFDFWNKSMQAALEWLTGKNELNV